MHRTLIALVLATALWMVSPIAPSAPAAPAWAPASTAAIHPGVQTLTAGAQCTANFVFYDAGGVYIGQAAHCASTGGQTATDGCNTGSLGLGTPVSVGGASFPGKLVYSSWVTMHALHETDPDVCAFNDLALVRLDPRDASKVNPSIPHWGGPVGINTSGTQFGGRVYSYGNSELRLGISALSPKSGFSLGDDGNGWSHDVYTVSPGIPGDSGSAFLDGNGRALGILSTLEVAPFAGGNGVGDINHELNYMHQHGGPAAVLAFGTQPFTGGLL